MSDPKTVFVGLSGGVDSSVAAARLLKQSYRVVGVFIKVWHPDFMVCNWEQERLDAMRVAAHLQIPFLTCDAEAEYRDEVAHYFIESYRAGLTPNPDVMCNKEVKFGAFLRFAKKHGADYIATGHYAYVRDCADEICLYRGNDDTKDQSYFLWTLTQEQLSYTLLPLGESTKTEIRTEAAALRLPTAQKKDSQGVCFLGQVDIPEFLSHYIELTPGSVYDEVGECIGNHVGAFVYTIGQRHGFSLTTPDANRTPHYVIAKDVIANTITVSVRPPHFTSQTVLELSPINIISSLPATLLAQTRYRQTPFPVTVQRQTATTLTLAVQSTSDLAAAGQSCVLYAGNQCLGGGTITGCQSQ